MSISRRSLIAGVAAGGALMAINAPAANARSRFVAAAKDPLVKKVATPAVGHAIKRGNSTTSLSAINSVTVSPWNNVVTPGYGDYNANGDTYGTSRVCLSSFDASGNSLMQFKPAGSEAVTAQYAAGRIYVPLTDPSQPANLRDLWNRTAVWESDTTGKNWTLRDIRDPQGRPYKAEHVWDICSAPGTNETLFISISSHKDTVHGLAYEEGVVLMGDFEGGFVPAYISSAPNQSVRLLPTAKQKAQGGNIIVRATRNVRGQGKEDVLIILTDGDGTKLQAVRDDGFSRSNVTNPNVYSDEHGYDHNWTVSDVFTSPATVRPSDVHEFGDGWRFEPGDMKSDRNVRGIQGYLRHRDKSKGFDLAIPNEENPEKDMGVLHTYMSSNSEVWHAIRSQFGDLTIINTQSQLVWHVNKGDFKRYKSADTNDKLRNELLKVSGDSFGVILSGNSGNPKLVFGTTDGYLLYIDGLLPYAEAKDMKRRAGTDKRFSDDYEYETYKYGMNFAEYRKRDMADIAEARRLNKAQGLRPRTYYKRVAD